MLPASLHHIPPVPLGHFIPISPAVAEKMMQEPLFEAFLHHFPPIPGKRPELEPAPARPLSDEIGATRKTGGSNWGYKPPLLICASRRGFSLCSSLSVIATLAAPKRAYLTNGSSYSFTLSLSTAISCFSWSLIYFLIVSSLRPTVLT